MDSPKFNPYVVLIIGVFFVSTSAIFVKLSTADAGVIAFYRLLFTVLLMLPLFLVKYVGELKEISKKDWFFSFIAGVFLAFHFILWFESLNYTSVASSTVLVTLQPLFAFVGTYFIFKERFTLGALIGGGVAIAGSFIIGWGDLRVSGQALYGDVLALIACALITGYLLFGQIIRKRMSLITYTFIVYFNCTIVLFFYVLFKKEAFYPYPAKEWLYFFLLAVLSNLLGHTLFNWSIKYISTSAVSMAILLEPIGASILAWWLLREKLMTAQIIGGAIVLAGLLLFVADPKKIKNIIYRRNREIHE
ncbi:membrane protein [Bacillus sp. FJAT-27231]|uniref:DMT family transporter n=1 Tax=Bacillus sp. FJAT-27231 TaxID=1679168 RepID=UPI000670C42F|nr:DMT family transporter [Bacillus sp. FJAT-27231]KMY55135.1 membrane protein [Bacillus sp. FJAT-27231]